MTDREKEIIENELTRIDECEQDVYKDRATKIAWTAGKFFATTEIRLLLDSMTEEPANDELEGEINRYLSTWSTSQDNGIVFCEKMARHFAKWQQEQIMKGAVNGGCFSYRNGYKHISCDIDEHLTDIKLGDKVKLIIIKED